MSIFQQLVRINAQNRDNFRHLKGLYLQRSYVKIFAQNGIGGILFMTANIPEHSGFTKIPYGKLGIIAMKGTEEIAAKVDKYIVDWPLTIRRVA